MQQAEKTQSESGLEACSAESPLVAMTLRGESRLWGGYPGCVTLLCCRREPPRMSRIQAPWHSWRAESGSLMSASCPQLCRRKGLHYNSLWVETWVPMEHTLCAAVLVLESTWVSRVLGSESFYQLESLPRVVQLEEEEDKGGGGKEEENADIQSQEAFLFRFDNDSC